jgi:hypothetical protein
MFSCCSTCWAKSCPKLLLVLAQCSCGPVPCDATPQWSFYCTNAGEQFSALLLAGSSTMIHVEISAHRMSSNRVCTAALFTLESFDCHAKTVQNTYHCHTLSLPPWNPFTATLKPFKTPITATPSATLETFYCHAPKHLSLPHPATLQACYCHAKHLSPPRPVALETSYCHTTACQRHTTATALPQQGHNTATKLRN